MTKVPSEVMWQYFSMKQQCFMNVILTLAMVTYVLSQEIQLPIWLTLCFILSPIVIFAGNAYYLLKPYIWQESQNDKRERP